MAPGQLRLRLGRIPIDVVSFGGALDRIEGLIAAGQGGYVVTPNIDHVVLAEDHPGFRDAYEGASLSLVDGQPLVWVSRLLGEALPEKISGSDLILPLMERAAVRRWRVYLLGGAPGVAAVAFGATRLLPGAPPRPGRGVANNPLPPPLSMTISMGFAFPSAMRLSRMKFARPCSTHPRSFSPAPC